MNNTIEQAWQILCVSLKWSRPQKEKAHLFVKFSSCLGKSRPVDTSERCSSVSPSHFRDMSILCTHPISFRTLSLLVSYLCPHCPSNRIPPLSADPLNPVTAFTRWKWHVWWSNRKTTVRIPSKPCGSFIETHYGQIRVYWKCMKKKSKGLV